MTEIVFVLITIYAVYVIHSVITSEKNERSKSLKDQVSFLKEEKGILATKVVIKQTKAKAEKLLSGNIKHPETAEVAKIASSYRMTKRWVKEALVAEGLLEKIYKINEIDDAVQSKISKALEDLQTMEKYQT
ncbi:MAG: hypothetical protein KAT04_02940 [Methylococcales bacterium]|nr:hypothetical protein [Methylococcales bacterium]